MRSRSEKEEEGYKEKMVLLPRLKVPSGIGAFLLSFYAGVQASEERIAFLQIESGTWVYASSNPLLLASYGLTRAHSDGARCQLRMHLPPLLLPSHFPFSFYNFCSSFLLPATLRYLGVKSYALANAIRKRKSVWQWMCSIEQAMLGWTSAVSQIG